MATHVSRILRSEPVLVLTVRAVSTVNHRSKDVKHYPMVVLGGGTGGCSVAARACRMLGMGNVAVVDPAPVRYLFNFIFRLMIKIQVAHKHLLLVKIVLCIFRFLCQRRPIFP